MDDREELPRHVKRDSYTRGGATLQVVVNGFPHRDALKRAGWFYDSRSRKWLGWLRIAKETTVEDLLAIGALEPSHDDNSECMLTQRARFDRQTSYNVDQKCKHEGFEYIGLIDFKRVWRKPMDPEAFRTLTRDAKSGAKQQPDHQAVATEKINELQWGGLGRLAGQLYVGMPWPHEKKRTVTVVSSDAAVRRAFARHGMEPPLQM